MIEKMCRICPNDNNWTRPSKRKKGLEDPKSFLSKSGFGLEDWLNREKWILSGYSGLTGEWRYSRIEEMNAAQYDEEAQVRLLLYINDKEPGVIKPTAVGVLEEAFVIGAEEARWATDRFAEKGWLEIMRQEVKAIDGDSTKLTGNNPLNLVNIRFRPDGFAKTLV
ncbi:MAG: hypothetical protein LBT86_00740 [Deltaproteobacteria bacterium]|jgi:hypothetical protein|nr:hypothetical protein [Deltaproteobacteria bacterium]